MEFIIFIALIGYAVLRAKAAKEQKQKQEEQRRRRAAALAGEAFGEAPKEADVFAQRSASAQPERARERAEAGWICACGSSNRADADFCTRCGRRKGEGAADNAYGGSMHTASYEGAGPTGSMRTASYEGAGSAGSMSAASNEGKGYGGSLPGGVPFPVAHGKSSLKHAVQPITESPHGHIESSMTGFAQCEEDLAQPHLADAYAISTQSARLPFGMKLNTREAVAEGVLYAEILGKPKALRRG